MIVYKKISVKPQSVGYLYINNVFAKELQPGVYRFSKLFRTVDAYFVPKIVQNDTIINQEVITKDNIAFRISLHHKYEITDGQKYIENCIADSLKKQPSEYYSSYDYDQRIATLIKGRVRELVAEITSEEINGQRSELEAAVLSDELLREAEQFGVTIKKVTLIDVTFTKSIQEIFASELAAKVRARTDLENARTAVASARAYKNAATMMQGDEGMQFLQLLETMQKIAQKGNHTFMIGENFGKK